MKFNENVCQTCKTRDGVFGFYHPPCALLLEDYCRFMNVKGNGLMVEVDITETQEEELRMKKAEDVCPYKLEHMVVK